MENNLKLMKPHTDDVATSFEKRTDSVCEESKAKLCYQSDCSYNYFGTNSGISYNDCERNTFWEY
ncbi:hypothetical protein [Romboutsia sp.]|uniref:hypothetical protein n=1 Tax=Romboutsia sp. TaxID=1965302 RepID=UPI003F3FB344